MSTSFRLVKQPTIGLCEKAIKEVSAVELGTKNLDSLKEKILLLQGIGKLIEGESLINLLNSISKALDYYSRSPNDIKHYLARAFVHIIFYIESGYDNRNQKAEVLNRCQQDIDAYIDSLNEAVKVKASDAQYPDCFDETLNNKERLYLISDGQKSFNNWFLSWLQTGYQESSYQKIGVVLLRLAEIVPDPRISSYFFNAGELVKKTTNYHADSRSTIIHILSEVGTTLNFCTEASLDTANKELTDERFLQVTSLLKSPSFLLAENEPDNPQYKTSHCIDDIGIACSHSLTTMGLLVQQYAEGQQLSERERNQLLTRIKHHLAQFRSMLAVVAAKEFELISSMGESLALVVLKNHTGLDSAVCQDIADQIAVMIKELQTLRVNELIHTVFVNVDDHGALLAAIKTTYQSLDDTLKTIALHYQLDDGKEALYLCAKTLLNISKGLDFIGSDRAALVISQCAAWLSHKTSLKRDNYVTIFFDALTGVCFYLEQLIEGDITHTVFLQDAFDSLNKLPKESEFKSSEKSQEDIEKESDELFHIGSNLIEFSEANDIFKSSKLIKISSIFQKIIGWHIDNDDSVPNAYHIIRNLIVQLLGDLPDISDKQMEVFKSSLFSIGNKLKKNAVDVSEEEAVLSKLQQELFPEVPDSDEKNHQISDDNVMPSNDGKENHAPITDTDDYKNNFKIVFTDECNTLLDSLESSFLKQLDTKNCLTILHTLKGVAATAEVYDIRDVALSIESVVHHVQETSIDYYGPVITKALEAVRECINTDLELSQIKILNKQPLIEEILSLREPQGHKVDPLNETSGDKDTFSENVQEVNSVTNESPAFVDCASEEGDELELDILEFFIEEMDEAVPEIQHTINSILDKAVPDKEKLIELKRHMHTLKGGANLAGATATGSFYHEMESLFERNTDPDSIMSLPILLWESLLSILIDSKQTFESGRQYFPPKEVMAWLTSGDDSAPLISQKAENNRSSNKQEVASVQPAPSIDGEFNDDKSNIISIEDTISVKEKVSLFSARAKLAYQTGDRRSELKMKSPMLKVSQDKIDTMIASSSMLISHQSQMRNAYAMGVNIHADLANKIESLRTLLKSEYSTIDSQVASLLTHLGKRVGELDNIFTEYRNQLNLHQLVVKDLQLRAIQSRLIRFNSLDSKLKKVVEKAANDVGKTVALQINGGDTMIDKVILDKISDPLFHILRNSVDHGIESESVRKKLKKTLEGNITLTVELEDNLVNIKVEDDGGGIVIDRVIKKAKDLGIWDEEYNYSDYDIYQLITYPGFSTANKVTALSGRGVGMDIVKSAIEDLSGSLVVDSELGKGSRFHISLPTDVGTRRIRTLTIASVEYAVLDSDIITIKKKQGKDIKTLFKKYTNPFITVDKEPYILIPSSVLINNSTDMILNSRNQYSLVLFSRPEGKFAIVVEGVSDDSYEVILRKAPKIIAVSGAIKGYAEVTAKNTCLVLDIAALCKQYIDSKASQKPVKFISSQQADKQHLPRVLIIDDSVLYQKYIGSMLSQNGFNPITTSDGHDGLEYLFQDQPLPSAIIVDYDMPRMNGEEFVKRKNNTPAIANIPVLMVTANEDYEDIRSRVPCPVLRKSKALGGEMMMQLNGVLAL